jgi:DNA-binding NtrC family response regulator
LSRILVIDDEPGICRALERFFREGGHEVRTSSRAETGLTLAEAFEPDLVLLDVRLPGMNGLDALARLRRMDPDLPVVVVTAYGTMETAVEAVRRGAWDYVLKPLDLESVSTLLERAIESRRLAGEVAIGEPREEPPPPPPPAAEMVSMVGRAPVMQEVFKRIGAVSLSDVPVLVLGESGTGKELAARAIHYASARGGEPFEVVSCTAVPEPRVSAEVFGRLERAGGGSLFLDDVAALPGAVQAALLRYLDEGTFEPEGGAERRGGGARVIAAAEGDLEALVGEGRIREDLSYRLNVVAIRIPPLRERVADIPLLVAHFLGGADGPEGAISKEALRLLLTWSWPGNVRELRSAVDHAVVLARRGTILPEHLPRHVREGAHRRPEEDAEIVRAIVDRALEGDIPEGEVFATVMARFEAPLVAAVLEKTGGNQVKAAKLLGIHRTTLRTKIQKYRL